MKHDTLRVGGYGLTLNVHRFAPDAEPTETVVCLHGFMDAGGTWGPVAEELCRRGMLVYAPDFRGFGRSDWVSGGGYYHFANYVADMTMLFDDLAIERMTLVGHSMGGGVACYYAGARAERIARLVLMEGIGPPDMSPEIAPTRMTKWLGQITNPKNQSPLASLDEAISRLAARHTNVDRDTLAHLAKHLTREKNGALHWAFDPLHRTFAPSLFRADALGAFLSAIELPVLFISGGDSGWHPDGEAQRLAKFPKPPRIEILEGAGHMMHWTRPTEVAQLITRFITAA